MPTRDPIAFMSYVRSDDDHDRGKISQLRARIEGEVKIQTGKRFEVFQDRNDIAWGQKWDERIIQSLGDVTFLIPILTPSFFESPACRSEFEAFLIRERTLGMSSLILPIHYVDSEQLSADFESGKDHLADILRSRQWIDWRAYRFKSFEDEEVSSAFAKMATAIKHSMKEFESIKAVAESRAEDNPAQKTEKSAKELAAVEREIQAAEKQKQVRLKANKDDAYQVPELYHAKTGDLKTHFGGYPAYYAFTRRFDEIVSAADFVEPSELLRHYNDILKYSDALQLVNSFRIQEKYAEIYLRLYGTRRRRKDERRSISIILLIDNSGSLRGPRILYTAAWMVIVTDVLERLGIRCEVLGFTTRAWKGGQSRELWLASGKPEKPGRLNDIRHIIYKSFSDGARAAAPNFGIMTRDGLLKENIDGEALLWAASRLSSEKSRKKLIFVLSDGAPVDDSTTSVNSDEFLSNHLKTVVEQLSEQRIILRAIGLGIDVSRHYPGSVIADEASIGLTILRAFEECFGAKKDN